MSRLVAPRFEVTLFPEAQVAAGPRYLVAWLPAFRVERCGWRADEPVALVAEQRSAVRIVALSPAARELGLGEGMTAAEARARVPGLPLDPWDEVGESADQAELVRALEPCCDRVAAFGPEAVVMEIAQATAWYGSEAKLLERLRARLEELGHAARLGVSDHPQAALAWVGGGHEGIVPKGEGARALAALPLALLAPSTALAEAWVTLGFSTIGQLARLDAASVAGRWGAEGVELHRVARGQSGAAWTVRAVEAPIERLRLPLEEELVQVAAVLQHLEAGLHRLREVLTARDRVAAALEVRLELAWGPSVTVQVRVAHPSRDPVLLAKLLRDKLSRTTLEAPVVGLLLHASEVVPDGEGQGHLLERRSGGGRWSELLSRLLDVLGGESVGHLAVRPAWCPEAASHTVPVSTSPRAAPSRSSSAASAAIDDPVEVLEGASWRRPRPRPTRLRALPLPVRVRAKQGCPLALGTRKGWQPLWEVRGPERISGAWWEPEGGFDRSYWVAALPEGTAWLFEAQGQWFVHGWFD